MFSLGGGSLRPSIYADVRYIDDVIAFCRPCARGFLTCHGNGECVYGGQNCDDYKDCKDGSDEAGVNPSLLPARESARGH